MDADRTRPLFLSDKLLRADDLTLEQRYQRDGYGFADRALHTYGIGSGLDLASAAPGRITVAAGLAFDAAGEQVSLDAPVEIDLRTAASSSVWITIRYGETPADAVGDARGTFYRRVVVAPVIAVRASNQSPDIAAGTELVLGRIELSVFGEVIAIDPGERRSSGVTVGRLDFLNPTSNPAGIAAGSDPGSLDIHSPQTDIFASVVVRGAVGAGVTGPAAGLQIAGIPEVPGHGTIWFGAAVPSGSAFRKSAGSPSSSDYAVYGDGTYFSGQLSPGDAVCARGPDGRMATAIVTTVTGPNLLTATLAVGSPLPPTSPVPFVFRPRLLARIRRGDGQTVLAVTALGQVGIGTDSPGAALHIASGDLGLGSGNLSFIDEGKILADRRARSIQFTSDGALSILEPGDITLSAGAVGASSTPTLVIKGASGHVGIGTTDPLDALTVNGVIQATAGFMFPDGVVQKVGVVPIPIGTVVDWWQPEGSPALCPDGFQICDGSTVDDPTSPLKGTALPDLDDRFTRAVGSYEDIGKPGGAIDHTHTITLTTHDHAMPHQHAITVSFSATTSTNGIYIAGHGYSTSGHVHTFADTSCTPPLVATGLYTGSASAPTAPASAVPPSMYLLKIMRIR
jgi:hypothetical protein